MAYYTGTSVSFAGLVTALQAACVAEGWTLSGNVLHRGSCYAEVVVTDIGETGAPTASVIAVRAGNGIDGSNALTDAPSSGARIGRLRDGTTGSTPWPDWPWPVTYHLHIFDNPDEVFFFVTYGGQYWQHLMFGQSPAPGNPGTGNWHSGIFSHWSSNSGVRGSWLINSCSIAAAGGLMGSRASGSNRLWVPAPFWWRGLDVNITPDEANLNGRIHGCIDDNNAGAAIWSHEDQPVGWSSLPLQMGKVSSSRTVEPLPSMSPSTFSGQAQLFPIMPMQERADGKSSIIGHLKHIRFCRNDFIEPGEVISIGPDRWKVYPCYRKFTDARDGGSNIDHSGTFALAIEYDGP